ncbi:hypothetical protein A2U01_0038503, partial [Trifolium medium]|nr:hypothetical protein [Trifolium medium]
TAVFPKPEEDLQMMSGKAVAKSLKEHAEVFAMFASVLGLAPRAEVTCAARRMLFCFLFFSWSLRRTRGIAAPRAELCFRAGWFPGSCAARRFVLRRAQAWFVRVDFC